MLRRTAFRSLLACVLLLLACTSVNSLPDKENQSPSKTGAPPQPAAEDTLQEIPEVGREKRNAERLQEDIDREYPNARDKKTPRGFLGIRGKKLPSRFLGLRGRRDDSGSHFSEVSEGVRPLEAEERAGPFKRAPSGFLGMRGKKAPSGFLGLRGKKAPSSFLGLRGKKAPSGFLGMRGKKAPSDYPDAANDFGTYDDLEDVLQALRHRYGAQKLYEQEKRAPKGFLGMRGKKAGLEAFEDEYYMPSQESLYPNTYNDVIDDVINDKRAPSAFLGMRG